MSTDNALKSLEEKVLASYFTPNQVKEHSSPNDCWLSWLGKVYDLTELVQKNSDDPLIIPIINSAGMDISHWFDKKSGDLLTQVHPNIGSRIKRTPYGQVLDVPPDYPTNNYATLRPSSPWWLAAASDYFVGYLTIKTRRIKIENMLTHQVTILEVSSEETVAQIQKRYLEYNRHAEAYVWKRLGHLMDMYRTLEENDVPDEDEAFEKYGINEEEWLPTIHVYFSDDLTVDPPLEAAEAEEVHKSTDLMAIKSADLASLKSDVKLYGNSDPRIHVK